MSEHESTAFTGLVRQSYAGAIRQRLATIERKVHSGVRHEAIRRELAQEGVSASIGTFRKSLSRARVWWRKQIWLQQGGQMDSIANQVPAIPLSVATKREGLLRSPSHGDGAPQVRETTRSTAGWPQPAADQKVASRNSLSNKASTLDLDQFFQRKSVFKKS